MAAVLDPCRDRCCSRYAVGAWVLWDRAGAAIITLNAGAQLDLGRAKIHNTNGGPSSISLTAGFPVSIGALGVGGGNKLSVIASCGNAAYQMRLEIEEGYSPTWGPSAVAPYIINGATEHVIKHEVSGDMVGIRVYNDLSVQITAKVLGILRSA